MNKSSFDNIAFLLKNYILRLYLDLWYELDFKFATLF